MGLFGAMVRTNINERRAVEVFYIILLKALTEKAIIIVIQEIDDAKLSNYLVD